MCAAWKAKGSDWHWRAGWPQLPVSRMWTEALIDTPAARRSTLASTALDGALAQRRPGPILCSDLALLFEPLLALDPLALLRQWSRSLPVVLNTRLQQAATSFAGRYKVVRMELGAVTRRLYCIITDQLSAFLQSEGIDYQFPRLDEVGENKSSLLQPMHLFNTKYPDHGLLLVVDELLDYLRTQDAAGLNLDFGYLRELGEVTELAPFRFIVGIQESLFDSPSFALELS